jgi:CDP-glucose 4,6-dehydratase
VPEANPDPSFWRGKRVLVTGATGFLGGSLVARLLEYKSDVLAIVRNDRPQSRFAVENLAAQCRVIPGDMASPEVVKTAFDAGRIDALFHLAANSDVEDFYRRPAESFRSATDGTLQLLEAVRHRAPDCAVVVSSSDKAYGPQAVPYRESQNLAPRHPYEVAKASQDLLAQSYGKVYGLAVAVTRCANYFGGWDFNWHRIIPGTIRSVARGEPVVLRSDGKFTRDFLYIEDAVDAQLLLAQAVARDPKLRGEPFNFSQEINIEVIDIVRRILTLMDSKTEPQINETAKAEIRFMQVNCDKARTVLDWRPRHDFDLALVETVKWYRGYLSRSGG